MSRAPIGVHRSESRGLEGYRADPIRREEAPGARGVPSVLGAGKNGKGGRVNTWRKGIAAWKVSGVLYLSVPFTWLLPEAEQIARKHKGKVIAGGPAVQLMGAPWADETPKETPFDVLAMHNPCATFTTRGCIRSCPFCVVPKIEGEFRELANWKPAPLVCDNNILAASRPHFERVIDSLMCFPFVDFNQGLDARLLTSSHIEQLCRLQGVRVRFAFDFMNQEGAVFDAIHRCRAAGLKDFGVYVLIGFDDTPDDALARLEKVRSWDILPNPMRYQPLDVVEKDSYVAPQWNGNELRHIMRYYSRLTWLGHIPFSEYGHRIPEETLLDGLCPPPDSS